MGYVYFDNKIQDEKEVSISLRCSALNYGLGCFEGIRAYYDEENDKMYGFLFKEHYERLLNSCKVLNLKINHTVEKLCEVTIELIKKNDPKCNTYIRPLAFKDGKELGIKLIGNDNDKFGIFLTPMNRFIEEDCLSVCISSFRRISDNAIPTRIKSTGSYVNSALASFEAYLNGYDEAIFLKEDGYVCEGPGENIFMVKGNKLVTPSTGDGILEGLTRNLVIKLSKEELSIEVCERAISRSELYSADELFFSGTAMQVSCITSVDKRIIGNGKHGEIYKKINDLFTSIALCKNEKYKYCCTEI
jgi:branched-chain amino acid aminotransferase